MSTLSSDRSDDSYRKKYTMMAPVRLQADKSCAQRNVADVSSGNDDIQVKGGSLPANTKPKRNWISLMIKGVKNASRKFHSQLEPAASEAWYERVRVGNVSPVKIQIPL
jgi:hypothetical protein